jgi:hypothetical protein
MKHTSNVKRNDKHSSVEMDRSVQDNRAEIISTLFPHLSLLERFVLSTVLAHEPIERLGDANNPDYFDLTYKDKGLSQYVEYLKQKTKWEERKIEEKAKGRQRPITIYRYRDPETVEPV